MTDIMGSVDRLAAVDEIKRLKARYFRGVDMKDHDILMSCFTEDVTLDYRGATTDPATGINYIPHGSESELHGRRFGADVIVEALQGIVSVHHSSGGEVSLASADEASAVWPMVDRLLFAPGGPIREMIGYGHYHETYRREDGAWKIRTLRLTRLRVDIRRD